jgi:hypothetical protein
MWVFLMQRIALAPLCSVCDICKILMGLKNTQICSAKFMARNLSFGFNEGECVSFKTLE